MIVRVLGFCLRVSLILLSVTSTSADEEKGTILVLGDSLSAGYGLDPAQAYPALLQGKIEQQGFDFRVINAGVSGDTSAAGARRISWLLRRKVDVLILELGANDGLRGIDLDSTKRNLQAIIDTTRDHSPGARIVIAGMQVPPNLGPRYTEQFRSLFVELAEDNGAHLIPFLLKGVGGKPELNLPDGIHPTAEGHQIIAETVWVTLEPILRCISVP
jgi:acyl-CoA thioesterase-1